MSSAAVPKPVSETPPPSYEEALYRSDSDSRPLRSAFHFPLVVRQSVRLPGSGPVTEESPSLGTGPVVTSEVRVEEAGNQSEISTPALNQSETTSPALNQSETSFPSLEQSEEARGMLTASATIR